MMASLMIHEAIESKKLSGPHIVMHMPEVNLRKGLGFFLLSNSIGSTE